MDFTWQANLRNTLADVFYYMENFSSHLAAIFNHCNMYMNEDK